MGRGNEKTGVKGYISCYKEIKIYQEIENILFDYIFVTSGTGITQAGLIVGSILEKGKERIIGISISRVKRKQEEYIYYCLKQYFGNTKIWDRDIIQVYDETLQGGYGHISEKNKKCLVHSGPLLVKWFVWCIIVCFWKKVQRKKGNLPKKALRPRRETAIIDHARD